jgi:hypothetical protein
MPQQFFKGECVNQVPTSLSDSWINYDTGIGAQPATCQCNISEILSSNELRELLGEDGAPGERGPKGEKVRISIMITKEWLEMKLTPNTHAAQTGRRWCTRCEWS